MNVWTSKCHLQRKVRSQSKCVRTRGMVGTYKQGREGRCMDLSQKTHETTILCHSHHDLAHLWPPRVTGDAALVPLLISLSCLEELIPSDKRNIWDLVVQFSTFLSIFNNFLFLILYLFFCHQGLSVQRLLHLHLPLGHKLEFFVRGLVHSRARRVAILPLIRLDLVGRQCQTHQPRFSSITDDAQ